MKFSRFIFAAALVLILTATCHAHFGMVIPSDNMISQSENRKLTLNLSFSHPFEFVGMDLVKPQAFVVAHEGKTTDLLDTLTRTKVMGSPSWQSEFKIKRPGAYAFAMTPKPYWEPAEDCFIIHYTKTLVAAFGDDTGWDAELGLETEIVPLSRPFALYAGNIFQGIVKKDGKPVPFATVEVEFFNESQTVKADNDLMITQTIKADKNGVFSYSVPASGWWGFSALTTSDKKMVHENEKKDIELGAVIWVKFENWQDK